MSFLKSWLCKSFVRNTAIYMINASRCGPGVSMYAGTMLPHGYNSGRGQNAFPKLTPQIPGIPARRVKIPPCCQRNTELTIRTRSRPKVASWRTRGLRSPPCLRRQKERADRPDVHSHLLALTAALTDVSANKVEAAARHRTLHPNAKNVLLMTNDNFCAASGGLFYCITLLSLLMHR